MQWIALACTAENEVLAWSDNLSILESACEGEFRAICRIYGVEDVPAQQLRQFNLDFVIKFNGPRNTALVAARRPLEIKALSHCLQSRVGLVTELQQRISHGFKRFTPVVEWQLESYEEKYRQAMNVVDGMTTDIGMVEDHAEEHGLSINVAAGIIINKYHNRKFLIRKLERLRIRHQRAIRNAKNKEDFAKCKASMEEDSFLSMMM
ncbi:hypothetical protein UFOVP71_439 [uncultured Caudovirales phage]|uniref:Uncharacterized protein n=1 Tax=uncultured Caudovirales phage TaxID=2100421 RepID=A0A6J5TBA6_9CAUD|nr:hypothetical protein UFOVP71_439 [uncultured Caudovirales phage]